MAASAWDQLSSECLGEWEEDRRREGCGGNVCDVRVQCQQVSGAGEGKCDRAGNFCTAKTRSWYHVGRLESDACRQRHGDLEGSFSDGGRRRLASKSVCDEQARE